MDEKTEEQLVAEMPSDQVTDADNIPSQEPVAQMDDEEGDA